MLKSSRDTLKRRTDRARFQLWRLRDTLLDKVRGRAHRRQVFEQIQAGNLWGGLDSVSGTGSDRAATARVREQLPSMLRALNVRSMLDAPCGDFAWAGEIAAGLERYVGIDIVEALVTRNTERHGSETVSFLCRDLCADPLPPADLILCRDCLIHLPTRLIRDALRNFRATGARFVLLTNTPDAPAYRDIPIGSFRVIDLRRPPFSFPEPLRVIEEDRSGSRQLCLWELSALPID